MLKRGAALSMLLRERSPSERATGCAVPATSCPPGGLACGFWTCLASPTITKPILELNLFLCVSFWFCFSGLAQTDVIAPRLCHLGRLV